MDIQTLYSQYDKYIQSYNSTIDTTIGVNYLDYIALYHCYLLFRLFDGLDTKTMVDKLKQIEEKIFIYIEDMRHIKYTSLNNESQYKQNFIDLFTNLMQTYNDKQIQKINDIFNKKYDKFMEKNNLHISLYNTHKNVYMDLKNIVLPFDIDIKTNIVRTDGEIFANIIDKK